MWLALNWRSPEDEIYDSNKLWIIYVLDTYIEVYMLNL